MSKFKIVNFDNASGEINHGSYRYKSVEIFRASDVIGVFEFGEVASVNIAKGIGFGLAGFALGGVGVGTIAGTVAGANSRAEVTCLVWLTTGQALILALAKRDMITLRVQSCNGQLDEVSANKLLRDHCPQTESDLILPRPQRPKWSRWPHCFWAAVACITAGSMVGGIGVGLALAVGTVSVIRIKGEPRARI